MADTLMDVNEAASNALINSTSTIGLSHGENYTGIMCIPCRRINSRGLFHNSNPLAFLGPLTMIQLFLASSTTLLTSMLLKPLGVPTMISQIIGGLILGPSFLGKFHGFTEAFFPSTSFQVLDTFAAVGASFYLFLIGLQMDPWLITKAGRKELVIGSLVVIVPGVLSILSCSLVAAIFNLDKPQLQTLIIVAAAESSLAFPVVAYFLSEVKILTSEFSRVALSTSMVSGVISFSLATGAVSANMYQSTWDWILKTTIGCVLIVLVIVFILRPLILSMVQQIPEGQTMKEGHMCFIFVTVLCLAAVGMKIGIHIFFGPFILGMLIPSGPPLGPALIERLDFFISWMVMPIFYAEQGMRVDLFAQDLKSMLIIETIILMSCAGKFVGAYLPSLYYNMSSTDAILLGFTVNVQGILELSMFGILYDGQLIDRNSFVAMCITLLIRTGVSTPIVKSLYRSSRKYIVHNTRTIEHSQRNTEIRILACIHDQENVPGIIHLLKASNPTKNSPIHVTVMQLVELVGRGTPMLISHKVHKGDSATNATTQRILNVFSRYEENSHGAISVHPFTMVSPFTTMQNDICTLALNKRTSLIILPFHKQLDIGTTNTHSRAVNCDVLDHAPCSVCILIDRGLLGGFKFVLANWVSYNVGLIFFGGADDREALAYGLRMSEHPKINLTVIQFIDTDTDTGSGINEDPSQKTLDDAAVNGFKTKTAYNARVIYTEEEVDDGTQIIDVIASMDNKYELIIMGRRHDDKSVLACRLTDPTKYKELGIIGDIFVSAEYGGKATILVVQQQTIVAAKNDNFKDLERQPENQNNNQSHNMLKKEAENVANRKEDI